MQLGDDRPSHILVPAIHKNRAEIRDIFLREMGDAPADLTDDPPRLAAAARAHLRNEFLNAKVGVSGANFAIAGTGSLVVVESEGNGRMCLTLPDTLISVVGVEKVLPSWQDLEVFLALLPRSSTAERMNPYTTIWTGVADGDGPRNFHLVLLDNGRTATLADATGRQALRCIRCSACLNVCPVYERAGGHAYGSPYPGPIGAILSPQLRGVTSEIDASLPYASSLCGACYEVCPVAINIPEVLVELRARSVEQHRHPVERAVFRLSGYVLSSPRRLAAAQRAASAAATSSAGPAASAACRRPCRPGPTPATPRPRPRSRSAPGGPAPEEAPREHRPRGDPGPHPHRSPTAWGAPVPHPPRRARPSVARRPRPRSTTPTPRCRATYRRAHHDPASTDIVALFAERAADYRAVVERVSAADLPAAIARVLAAVPRFLVPDGVPPTGWRACRAATGPKRPPRSRPARSPGTGSSATIRRCPPANWTRWPA